MARKRSLEKKASYAEAQREAAFREAQLMRKISRDCNAAARQ